MSFSQHQKNMKNLDLSQTQLCCISSISVFIHYFYSCVIRSAKDPLSSRSNCVSLILSRGSILHHLQQVLILSSFDSPNFLNCSLHFLMPSKASFQPCRYTCRFSYLDMNSSIVHMCSLEHWKDWRLLKTSK